MTHVNILRNHTTRRRQVRVELQRRNTSRVSSLLEETPVQLLRYSILSYDIPLCAFDCFIMAVDNWWSSIPQYSRPWWAGFIRRAFHLHAPSTSARRDCPKTTNGVHSQLPTRPRWLDARQHNRPQDHPRPLVRPPFNVFCWLSPLRPASRPASHPGPRGVAKSTFIGPHLQCSAYFGLAQHTARQLLQASHPAIHPRRPGLLRSRLILGLQRCSDIARSRLCSIRTRRARVKHPPLRCISL